MGYGLWVLADKKKGGDLLDRLLVQELILLKKWVCFYPIGVQDSIELEPNEYRFLLRGKELERSTIIPDRVMAMNMGDGDISKLKGIPCIEPFLVFRLHGYLKMIRETQRLRAVQ